MYYRANCLLNCNFEYMKAALVFTQFPTCLFVHSQIRMQPRIISHVMECPQRRYSVTGHHWTLFTGREYNKVSPHLRHLLHHPLHLLHYHLRSHRHCRMYHHLYTLNYRTLHWTSRLTRNLHIPVRCEYIYPQRLTLPPWAHIASLSSHCLLEQPTLS